MLSDLLKTAIKVKDDVTKLCDDVVKKLDRRTEIENHKEKIGKDFEVAVPIYKNTPGEVYSDEDREMKYPARAMNREAHFERGAIVRVVHAGPAMLFVEESPLD